MIAALVDMWAEKHGWSEKSRQTVRRQLSEQDYDADTIHEWKVALEAW
jgi:hypothetical protein